jgi:peptidoglycan/xylan/chitin deacetylase (PgdA/CDA1 family)
VKAILTFHSLDLSGSVLSCRPSDFRSLVDRILESNTAILDLEELLDSRTTNGVAFTFDDGIDSVLAQAAPILREYGVPAHLFVISAFVGRTNRWPGQPAGAPNFDLLDWRGIEDCHDAGISIESHSASHADMRYLSAAQVRDECDTCDEAIEARTGRKPKFFAYPYGRFTPDLAKSIRGRYLAALTTRLGYLKNGDDLALLPRLDSYYLQSGWAMNIGSPLTRGYLHLRSWLRTLRGTQ